jgi:hypothetical protein
MNNNKRKADDLPLESEKLVTKKPSLKTYYHFSIAPIYGEVFYISKDDLYVRDFRLESLLFGKPEVPTDGEIVVPARFHYGGNFYGKSNETRARLDEFNVPSVITDMILSYIPLEDLEKPAFYQRDDSVLWKIEDKLIIYVSRGRFIVFTENSVKDTIKESYAQKAEISQDEMKQIYAEWDMLRKFVGDDGVRTSPVKPDEKSWRERFLVYLPCTHPVAIECWELFLMASVNIVGKYRVLRSILSIIDDKPDTDNPDNPIDVILTKLITTDQLCLFNFRGEEGNFTQAQLLDKARIFSSDPEVTTWKYDLFLAIPYLRDCYPENRVFSRKRN